MPFLPQLLNPRDGDAALLVTLQGQGRALLLDCGQIAHHRRELFHPVTDLFISHAHIDHFTGFDHILRSLLTRRQTLRVHGPVGITERVAAKLGGYTWNLLGEEAVTILVNEWSNGSIEATPYAAADCFTPGPSAVCEAGDLLLAEETLTARCALLDHRTPSLAFRLEEADHLRIDTEALLAGGWKPGPWLERLKRLVREGADPETPVAVDGKPFPLGDLAERLVRRERGAILAYVTDARGSRENFTKIIALARGADRFFCEGMFLEADRERADASAHLTARQAGRLAREAGVKRLTIFHASRRYGGNHDALLDEARTEFRETE
jgi:ribonuclease Z